MVLGPFLQADRDLRCRCLRGGAGEQEPGLGRGTVGGSGHRASLLLPRVPEPPKAVAGNAAP